LEIPSINIKGAFEHNLKGVNVQIERGQITVVTGVSGSGKSSLAFDTVLAEAQRRFFYTLSNYSRQFLDVGNRPNVKFISGLSPAISLAQNETLPSRRATVGTITDIAELLGVALARFGDKRCPDHLDQSTSALSVNDIADNIAADFDGKTIALCAPIAEKKKGNFATLLEKFGTRGFSKAFIDGKMINLSTIPKLSRDEKHTIKVIVDVVKVTEKNRARLVRSIETTFEEGDGFGEYFAMTADDQLDLKKSGSFSRQGGCRLCGFSWPRLDARYFSSNSLGQCTECNGLGEYIEVIQSGDWEYEVEQGKLDSAALVCPKCKGSGLDQKLRAIILNGKTAPELHETPVGQLAEFFEGLLDDPRTSSNPAFKRVTDQIRDNLKRIVEVGLDYLELRRRVRSLSGGELQRLKLAGILGESLRGVLYILDEPSQGLHPVEINRLITSLQRLKQFGNTIIIVDHDEIVMKHADWIIDLGPGGGADGGRLLAKFKPSQAGNFVNQSVTAKHLVATMDASVLPATKTADHGNITMHDLTLHNLKIKRVDFIRGQMNAVTGVSGAGKSSMVLSTLFENVQEYVTVNKGNKGKKPKSIKYRFCSDIEGLDGISRVELIDRKPVAKSSVSMPATYLDVFTDLREFYGQLPEAQVLGLSAASFSVAREGGRCEECKGKGEINLQMRFLADARVKCHVCDGKRYRPHLLNIKFNGLSLSEVLELTISETIEHFKTFKLVQKKLAPAIDLGLGYLKLGQSSASLSGGEAQRLKLVPYLVKQYGADSLVILDEPTTGLHFQDVDRLLKQLRRLVDLGTTIVLVEHNVDIILASDWLIDIGPGAALQGGKIVYQGLPRGIVKSSAAIAPFVAEKLH
jgi:excinuclease ABC subunit A